MCIVLIPVFDYSETVVKWGATVKWGVTVSKPLAVLISTWWSVCPIHQHCLDGLHDDDEACDGDDNDVALASGDHQNHRN